MSGDTYGYVTVDGNKVTVNNTGGEVLIYELTGTTSNGFFKVYGAKKQAIVLNGTNTLSDGSSAAYIAEGEEDLKAVLFSEAQLIFSGTGLLTVNALNNQEKTAISSDDYIRVLNSPTIKVSSGSGPGW